MASGGTATKNAISHCSARTPDFGALHLGHRAYAVSTSMSGLS